MIRETVWAGAQKFYPDDRDTLLKYLDKVIDSSAEKKPVKAVMLPHAGYFYSGAVAGKTISCVNVPDTLIILGPNHTGLGRPYSLMSQGQWNTPIGSVAINQDLAGRLLKSCPFIAEDESPHIKEHSIEVELPFLKYMNDSINIVPMVVSDFLLSRFEEVGKAIASVVKAYNKDILIVVSTDMTHYETEEKAQKQDKRAIDSILALKPEELFNRVNDEQISMCGFGPATVALYSCLELGCRQAQLIEYKTSGDVTDDKTNVVGYAGIVIP